MQYILSYAYLKYCCGSVLCLSYCKDNTLYAYSLNCSKDEAGKCVGPSNMDIVHVRATGHYCLSYVIWIVAFSKDDMLYGV